MVQIVSSNNAVLMITLMIRVLIVSGISSSTLRQARAALLRSAGWCASCLQRTIIMVVREREMLVCWAVKGVPTMETYRILHGSFLDSVDIMDDAALQEEVSGILCRMLESGTGF